MNRTIQFTSILRVNDKFIDVRGKDGVAYRIPGPYDKSLMLHPHQPGEGTLVCPAEHLMKL